ncbi:MAG: hypothetical protein ACHQNE_01375 [Candidatus Kapaibacterium sp.]
MRRSNPPGFARLQQIASSELLRFAMQFLLAMTFASNAFAQSPRTKAHVLSQIAAIPIRADFAIVAAKIHQGVDTAAAYRELDTLLSRAYGDMFWMYGCAGLYYVTQDVLRPDYKARIRYCWKHFTPYRGDTENHFLMYYGSLLLMSQAWADLPDTDWFMGESSKDIYAESKEYLDHWIDETVSYGQEEWDSPRYGYYYITPLALLAEYTKDARLKHRFEMMLEYELADYAADYLDGCYCGAHSRVGDDAAIDPRKAEITAYGKYFFEDSVSHLLPDVAFAAMTNFECPNIIRQIAIDRSQPYEQFSLKRGRQMLRYMDDWSTSDSSHDSTFHAPVYKYDYMTKDYCLGSMQGGIVQPIQQQSWSLVFNSDKPNNIITGLNPYVSATELGMFFPEYPSFMLERISGTKASYTSEDKWEGGSPYERIYQDKDVLVALYDLPDSEKYRDVTVYLPKELKGGVHDVGQWNRKWSFFQFDSTFIALYTIGIGQYHVPDYTRLIISAPNDSVCGYLVYCTTNNKTSKEEFFNHLKNLSLIIDSNSVRSKEDDGKTINILLRDPRKHDWLFHSPFLESKKDSGVLTIRYKGETRVLDFRE